MVCSFNSQIRPENGGTANCLSRLRLSLFPDADHVHNHVSKAPTQELPEASRADALLVGNFDFVAIHVLVVNDVASAQQFKVSQASLSS